MTFAIGIDVGTTHTKVIAVDITDGASAALASAGTPVVAEAQGEAHRPAQILEVVVALLRSVVEQLPDGAEVVALSVASVGEEVVLLDHAGSAIGDAITWYDPRGLEQGQAFLAGAGGQLALTRRWSPDATFSLFKLLWLRQHAPAQLEAATTWTDLGDYVLHGLGGELVMDWSHASRAGAFDLLERRWDRETLEHVALDVAFPALVPAGTVIGRLRTEVAARVGLSTSVALVTGGHDHLCAAYGAGLRSTRELFLSAGTSEAHLSLLRRPLEGEAARGVDQGCYVDDDSWYVHVNIHSGHFFRQWRTLLYGATGDEELYAELSAAEPGGMSFEIVSGQRLGRLEAVPYDADRAMIMRAVLEGLARRSADIVSHLESVAGHRYALILVAGHPARVPLWRHLRESTYGRPLARVAEPEAAAFGAAVLAARAVDPHASAGLIAARERWS